MIFSFNSQGCVVIASGSRETMQHWGSILRKAKIPCEVLGYRDDHLPTRTKHAELWVEENLVDRARSAIRGAEDADESLFW